MRLIWSFGSGPSTGGAGGLPPGFFPVAAVLASRAASLASCSAREMGMLKMGTVGLDGTKIHANASRHSALSWEHASKLEAQLKAEVADLLARAEAADEADVPDGMSIPEELALREKRLAKLAEARGKIEARAKERYERERAVLCRGGTI